MEFHAIYVLWLREIKRYLRSKSRIVGSLTMPILWLVVVGTGINSSFSVPGASYLSFICPGIIGMSLLFTSIFAGVSVIWDKQFGFLKEILVAPVSRTAIVLGKIAGSTTVSLITATAVMIAAAIVGALPVSRLTFANILFSYLFMILISVFFVSLGLAIASRLNNMEGFQMIMNLLVMPLFFLSGAFFPLNEVPWWMRIISSADPLMYGVDGLRGILVGMSRFPIMQNLIVLFSFSTVMILIASYLFNNMAE
ncbi:MAG: ABC transporter permease [archaeon]